MRPKKITSIQKKLSCVSQIGRIEKLAGILFKMLLNAFPSDLQQITQFLFAFIYLCVKWGQQGLSPFDLGRILWKSTDATGRADFIYLEKRVL